MIKPILKQLLFDVLLYWTRFDSGLVEGWLLRMNYGAIFTHQRIAMPLCIAAVLGLSGFGFGARILEKSQAKDLSCTEQKEGAELLVTGECANDKFAVKDVLTRKDGRDVTVLVSIVPAQSERKGQQTFYCTVPLEYVDNVLFGKDKVQIWPRAKEPKKSGK